MPNGDPGPGPAPLWQQVKVIEEVSVQLQQQVRNDQHVIKALYERIRRLEAAVANKVIVNVLEEPADADQGHDAGHGG